LTSFMTPSSLSDQFIPTKDVLLTYDPRTMILLLESYNSSRVAEFLSTQTRSHSLGAAHTGDFEPFLPEWGGNIP